MGGGATGDRHEVASRHQEVWQGFEQLLHSTNSEYDGFRSAIREQFSGFRIWTEDVGAHRTGLFSLDRRLREVIDVKEMVIALLSDLNEALQEALSIVSGEKQSNIVSPVTGPSGSPSNGQELIPEPKAAELGEYLEEVAHVITCLHEFSITIQNPAPLQESSSIDVSHFELLDIQHISNKFPGAEFYLVQRLGRSNTRRRQLLGCRKRHHEKAASQFDLEPSASVPSHYSESKGNSFQQGKGDKSAGTRLENEHCGDHQGLSKKEQGTDALSESTVTPYEQPKEVTVDQLSDTGFSQTSYSSSISGAHEMLCVPPLPNRDCAEAFQCPYCFMVITAPSQKVWKKHFFSDLRPYVCTFKDCLKPDHLFDNRNDWFAHETEMHRREYSCNICDQTSSSRADFKGHLQGKHSKWFNPSELETIVDRCERPIMSEQCCPLCPEKHATESLRRHLGGHLQQVALFVSSQDGDRVACEETSVGVMAGGKLKSGPNPASGISGTDENTLSEDKEGQRRFGPRVGSMLQRLDGPRRSKVLEWISEIPYSDHHRRISESRLADTCEWLFENKEYCAWRSSNTSKLLLLRGIAGAGKTYIVSNVIDYFLTHPTAEKLAYFYCDRVEKNCRDPRNVLSTLIHQIAQTDSGFGKYGLLKPVTDLYWSGGRMSPRLGLDKSRELLIQLTNICQTTICIDALDEVEPEARIQLFTALKDIMRRSKNRVNVFLTTRMGPYIHQQLAMFPMVELQLRPNANFGGIKRFVEIKLQNAIDDGLLLAGEVSQELKIEIWHVLTMRSNGMFQLAALQIALLCGSNSISELRHILENLPGTIVDAYDATYDLILSQKGLAPELAVNAFRWIQCSYEPLRSETLLDAITVRVSLLGENSRTEKIADADVLLKACRNLLILDQRLNVFQFAHSSLKDYLKIKLPKIESHSYIARVCLSILCTPSSWNTSHYETTTQTKEGGYINRHLLLYSAVFWPWHFKFSVKYAKDDQILAGLWNTFASETNYQRWLDYHRKVVRIRSPIGTFWRRVEALQLEGDNPLSAVCMFGLSPDFATAFESNPNVKGAPLGQLLLRASTFGDRGIVLHLIERGAPAYTADKDGRTALHWAAEYGHEGAAQLLLDKCADSSNTDKDRQTPLHFAARGGHEAVARLLLDWGADATAADKDGKTPLHFAVLGEHEAVARLLLGGGAGASAADKNGHTPLHVAVLGGHEAVARRLIEGGADLCAADRDGQTPLHFAARGWHEAVTRLLLDRAADASAADMHGQTSLHFAARVGCEAVARLLLDKGAKDSAADKDGKTPLHWAAEYGHEAVAQLLLDGGADASAADKYRQTPLHLAARYRCEAVAPLLLDKGAKVSAADMHGQTPLHFAARDGREAVARLLLDKGAKVSAAARDGKTPLHFAVLSCHEAVARLLLDGGADASAADENGRTPLHAAVLGGREAVAQLLLDRGADIKAADKDGRTPLHVAALNGHEKEAQMLIEKGADISATGKDGWTPLRLAESGDRSAMIALLRDRGATDE